MMRKHGIAAVVLGTVLALFACCPGVAQDRPLGSVEARRGADGLNRAIIYQVWMRSFTPEGTLRATMARLPHIADLGATIVYLSPLNVHGYPSLFGPTTPYEIKDYDAIDPEYGTAADLKALTAEAHRLGLKVIMDIVFAHSALDSVLLNRPGFYQRAKDGKLVMSPWKTPMPDFANTQVREYFINNMVQWVRDAGLDGYRSDVAGMVPVEFWEQARDALDKVNRDVIMLAEADVPAHHRKAFDFSYNFSYYPALSAVMLNGESAERVRQQWEKARASFPRGSLLVHSNDNHDHARADVVFGEKGAVATSILNFTLDGIPYLYNGQEIGDTTATHHQAHVPIRWEMYKPTAQIGSGLASRQAAKLQFYKRLIETRKQQPALTSGEVIWVDNSGRDNVVSFMRCRGDENILVLVNLSNRKSSGTADLPKGEYARAEELLAPAPARGGQRAAAAPPRSLLKLSGNKASFDLAAFDYYVGKLVP